MAAKQQPWPLTRTRNSPRKNDGTRSMGQILAREGEEDSRRRILSFSSEEPVDRYFGPEILDHSGDAVNLQRLNEIGVLLFNHDTDKVVGKILRAWVENGRGMAEVEFDTDADAETVFQKVRSGTLKTTSVRYRVDRWEVVEAGKTSGDGRFTGPCSIARKWTPVEVSSDAAAVFLASLGRMPPSPWTWQRKFVCSSGLRRASRLGNTLSNWKRIGTAPKRSWPGLWILHIRN